MRRILTTLWPINFIFRTSRNPLLDKKINPGFCDGDYIPKTAINATSFKELLKNSTVFIDKTLLIKHVLLEENKVILFSFPKGWGKSINLDMIKTFVEIEVDDYGECLDKEKRSNPKFFYSKSLNILNETKIVDSYMGKYPVIFLTFRNLKYLKYPNTLQGELYNIVHKMYNDHKYLLFSSRLDDYDKEKLNKKLTNKYKKDRNLKLNEELRELTRLLSKHFNKDVYIFIDQYNFLLQSLVNKLDSRKSSESSFFVANFFHNIADELYDVEKIIFADEQDIISYDPYCHTVKQINLLNKTYASYFGFTTEHMDYLFKQYQVSMELRHLAIKWYSGYYVDDLQLGNIASLIKWLMKLQHNTDYDSNELQKESFFEYWVFNDDKKLFSLIQSAHNPEIKINLLQLASGGTIKFDLIRKFSYKDYDELITAIEIISLLYKFNRSIIPKVTIDTNLFFSYLFFIGCLTRLPGTINDFGLPNYEVQISIKRQLLKRYYLEDVQKFGDLYQEIKKYLMIDIHANSLENLNANLKRCFENIIANKFKYVHSDQAKMDFIKNMIIHIGLQENIVAPLTSELYLTKTQQCIIFINQLNCQAMVLEIIYSDETANTKDIMAKNDKIKEISKNFSLTLVHIKIDREINADVQSEFIKTKDEKLLLNVNVIKNKSYDYTIILDLDGLLVVPLYQGEDISRAKNYWQIDNVMILGHTHVLAPGCIAFLRFLYSLPNIRTTYFSSAVKERNEQLIPVLLCKALGTSKYLELKDDIKIKSRDDLIDNPNSGDETNNTYSLVAEEYKKFVYGNKKKDLTKIVSVDELKQSLILEDDYSYVLYEQKENTLWLPCIDSSDIHSYLFNERKKSIYSLNHLFYAARVISLGLEITNRDGVAFSTAVWQIQTANNNVFKADAFDNAWLQRINLFEEGLNILKQFDKNLKLLHWHEEEHKLNSTMKCNSKIV